MSGTPKDYSKSLKKHARTQALRKAKKSQKRNRSARPPRRNDWADLAHSDWDSLDEDLTFERIMPRDESDRRKALEEQVQRTPAEQPPADLIIDGEEGLVVEVSSGLCRVKLKDEVILCSLRGTLSADETGYTNVVAVGDRVIVRDQNVVEQILPRRSQIARPDPFYSHLRQTLVANVDQLLIVAAWRNPQLWPELIDRYLIAARRSDVTPVICINKIDLAGSPEEVTQTALIWQQAGFHVVLTSAARGDGLDELVDVLEGKVTALAGLSGVGKSTLLNAIHPDFDLKTGRTNEDWGQGRHTTTQSIMLPFGEDGYVVDTPGIREFGLAGLTQADLIMYYPEMTALAYQCRFADCQHDHEPECAVREAVEAGRISPLRFETYQKIRATLPGE